MFQHCIFVGILGFEVLDTLGFPLVQPVVIIDAGVAVDGQLLGYLLSLRRLDFFGFLTPLDEKRPIE